MANATFRLEASRRSGNQPLAEVGSDCGGVCKDWTVDPIVINHGTIPPDELYFGLKPPFAQFGRGGP